MDIWAATGLDGASAGVKYPFQPPDRLTIPALVLVPLGTGVCVPIGAVCVPLGADVCVPLCSFEAAEPPPLPPPLPHPKPIIRDTDSNRMSPSATKIFIGTPLSSRRNVFKLYTIFILFSRIMVSIMDTGRRNCFAGEASNADIGSREQGTVKGVRPRGARRICFASVSRGDADFVIREQGRGNR